MLNYAKKTLKRAIVNWWHCVRGRRKVDVGLGEQPLDIDLLGAVGKRTHDGVGAVRTLHGAAGDGRGLRDLAADFVHFIESFREERQSARPLRDDIERPFCSLRMLFFACPGRLDGCI